VDPQGRIAHQARYDHDVAGLAGLTAQLGRHGPVTGIAIERGEGLPVEMLQDQGHWLFCVSPKMSARARERYRVAPGKSDAFDAFVLADSLRHEHRHWRPLAVPSPLLAELRALTRDRERLVWNQRDTENQLRAVVLAYHPAVLGLFSTAGKAFAMLLFIDQLELVNGQVRAITRRIGELLAGHPDAAVFLSVPGMGQITAATMLAEMGEDRARFPTPDTLLAETGTAPVTRASGRSRTVRFRYAANKRMRHAIDWWAFVSVREIDWARDAYDQARARGQQHNRALRGIGARWVRILWRCWTDSTPYDPARHLKGSTARRTATRKLPATPGRELRHHARRQH